MTVESPARLLERFATAAGVDDLGDGRGGVLIVEDPPADLVVPALLPRVVVSTGPCAGVDVVTTPADHARVIAAVESHPQAATALAVLLRNGAGRSVADAVHAESATYGVLQAGDEFRRWRAANPPRRRAEPPGPTVVVERVGDVLRVELCRPRVRNAIDAAMRDELVAALIVAADAPELRVELRGAGASFCAGGDLDEFGTRPDPVTAHLVRLSRHLGWLMHQIADRSTVFVQGANAGSGVELAAFAGTVVARPDATFRLPEIGLGLIPGAGGTVSLPRRIGRQRTALLALSGRTLDAATALEWRLVDRVEQDA